MRGSLRDSAARTKIMNMGETELSSEPTSPVQGPAKVLGKRPNILIIMCDEMRYPTVYESEELKAYRKEYLKTQELLRRNGLEFHRHYAASVACVPSRASLY